MKIKCDYCNNQYEDYQKQCPFCGAPNPADKRNASDKKPRTIEELKKWYADRKLPPYKVTRFFIGENYTSPKAFGIYKNDRGEFVVYKNKADGSRAIRYQGKDEEYAVNELYQKLKDEIVHQKAANQRKPLSTPVQNRTGHIGNISYPLTIKKYMSTWVILVAVIFFINSIAKPYLNRHNGYYRYNDTMYYHISDDWYYYNDDYDYWYITSPQSDPAISSIENDYDDYFISGSWNNNIQAMDWDDTTYYDDYHSSNDYGSSYDSDYDWDSGSSWDSGGSDWDSDW